MYKANILKIHTSNFKVKSSLEKVFLSFLESDCALVIYPFRRKKLNSVELFFNKLAITYILHSLANYSISHFAAFRHRWDFGQIGKPILHYDFS